MRHRKRWPSISTSTWTAWIHVFLFPSTSNWMADRDHGVAACFVTTRIYSASNTNPILNVCPTGLVAVSARTGLYRSPHCFPGTAFDQPNISHVHHPCWIGSNESNIHGTLDSLPLDFDLGYSMHWKISCVEWSHIQERTTTDWMDPKSVRMELFIDMTRKNIQHPHKMMTESKDTVVYTSDSSGNTHNTNDLVNPQVEVYLSQEMVTSYDNTHVQ